MSVEGEGTISQPGGRDAGARESNEVPEQEKQAVAVWQGRVRRAEEMPWRKEWKDELETLRGYVYGTKHRDAQNVKLVRTNMVFASIAAMMPHLYARDPDFAIQPSPACPKERLPVMKAFCETANAVVHELLIDEARLKKRVKANLRATSTTSYGVLKLIYQSEWRGDPLQVRRIHDTQDNLARIEAMARELKKEDDPATISRLRDDIQANLKSLQASNEVQIYKGFAVDRLRSEDFLILDDDVTEFDEYEDAAALAQLTWMTVADFRTKFDREPHGATRFNAPHKPGNTSELQQGDDMFVCVVEIWDKKNGVVRTIAKGMAGWVRPSFAPKHAPQRFYPFHVLGFNIVEGRWRPISDVELLMGLQDEYNTTRTNYADAREDAVPRRVFRKGGNLTEEDIIALRNQKNRDWVGVEGNPAIPLSQDLVELKGNTIDPAAYDVTIIRNDMDLLLGMSDASRANLIKPKTATEAELMQEALMSRVSEKRDANEDLITDMGVAVLETALRCFTKAEIQQIAGEDAEWPEVDPNDPMAIDEIFRLVTVTIRAGSSGKPNQQKERDQWLALLPVIKETMAGVTELRMAGNFDMASAAVELLRETLRRFEERLDVDSLIPPLEMGEDGQPVMLGQMMQELQAKVQQLTEELQTAIAERDKAMQGEQSKLAAEQTKQQQMAMEDERKRSELEQKAELEREEMERRERLDLDERNRRDALEQDARERADRQFSQKLEHERGVKTETERIRLGTQEAEDRVVAAGEERSQLEERMTVLTEKLEVFADSVMKLAVEVEENTSADRIPEFGPDGMPSRVTLKKKPRKPKETEE
jgi:hypothetical protein